MSGSDGSNTQAISADGVDVAQTFSEEEFGVPAVSIHLESRREDPVRIELDVAVPAATGVDRVGFHPDYDPEHWSIDDGALRYRTELPAGGETTTVYAVQDLQDATGSTLLDKLSIAAITPMESSALDTDRPADEGKQGSEHENDSREEVTARESAASTGEGADQGSGESEDGAAEATAVATPHSAGRSETVDASPTRPGTPSASGPGTADSRPDEPGSAGDLSDYPASHLADELVRRLDSGDLSPETTNSLRSQLAGVEPDSPDGLERRVGDLQRRVSDIEAFSTSVEAIHEVYGSPVEAFDEAHEQLTDLAQTVEGLDERVGSIEAHGANVEPRLAALEEEIESVQSDLSSLESRVDSATEERSEMQSTLSDLVDWREQFMGSLTDLGGD
jgi:archaellum component FlaC